ncbi:MAG: dephospho-CoA kinase [Alphaproteobacteria bacterium]|nr:MAG: dephospho-CoA kinase [Alphaproteobacteria bacterium]
MRCIGITGGIASGKSSVAKLFRYRNIPVFDADIVARHGYDDVDWTFLYHFDSEINCEQGVDRAVLRALIARYPVILDMLAEQLHPYVWQKWHDFKREHQRRGTGVIAAEVPLLLECGWQNAYDAVWVTHAPQWLRIQRVFKRHTMNEATLRAILERQYRDHERCSLADVIIPTAHGKADMALHVWRYLDK